LVSLQNFQLESQEHDNPIESKRNKLENSIFNKKISNDEKKLILKKNKKRITCKPGHENEIIL